MHFTFPLISGGLKMQHVTVRLENEMWAISWNPSLNYYFLWSAHRHIYYYYYELGSIC